MIGGRCLGLLGAKGGGSGGGGSAFNPDNIASLVGWYESGVSTLTDAGGGKCSEISDESTSGIGNLVQTVDADRPLIVSDVQNGRPGLRFDGLGDHLKKASVTGTGIFNANTFHFFIVIKKLSVQFNQNLIVWGSSSTDRIFISPGDGGTIYFDYGSAFAARLSTAIPGSGWNDAWIAWEGYRDGGTMLMNHNGSLLASDTGNTGNLTASNTKDFRLGEHYTGTFDFEGDFGAALLFNEVLAGDDLTNVRTYLSDNWGVTF
ncbi:MAG: hypothetical protein GY791_08255 [Alphaproteobacteria bacterium]|nr:hypothetical protein [Alphaproteobacteria bacterium]